MTVDIGSTTPKTGQVYVHPHFAYRRKRATVRDRSKILRLELQVDTGRDFHLVVSTETQFYENNFDARLPLAAGEGYRGCAVVSTGTDFTSVELQSPSWCLS